MIAALRFEAARRHPWLRAANYHAEMVRLVLADPAVAGDAGITWVDSAMDRPDALIGGRHAADVIPDTPASRSAHLERDYIHSDEQLVVYLPATAEFLAEIYESAPEETDRTK